MRRLGAIPETRWTVSDGDGGGARSGGDPLTRPLAWLAGLRLLLLPIVFAGDRLVAHPTVGTANFDLIFAIACVYAVLALLDSLRRRPRLPGWLYAGLDLAFICALAYQSGGAFSQLIWAFALLPLGSAILRDPRRTAQLSAISEAAYLLVALTHPATHPQQLDLILVQGLYIAWVGIAAVVLSTLLARRQARIVALAAEQGALVAQALEAEERARGLLADDLHDSAIQNLLAARQDLAEARHGGGEAIDRAEAAVRLAIDHLRATVRDLHPYVLDQLGLEAALEALADQQAHRHAFEASTQVDPKAVGVCDQLVLALARELLTNVGQHANAGQVSLELIGAGEAVELAVSDDGDGFPEGRLEESLRQGHIGLASCRERVRSLGGHLEIRSRPGHGTTVRCVVPRPLGSGFPHNGAEAVGIGMEVR